MATKKAPSKAPAKKAAPRKRAPAARKPKAALPSDPNVAAVPRDVWNHYAQLRLAREQYEAAEKEARAEIEKIAGEAEQIRVEGEAEASVVWRHLKIERFDSTAHKKGEPECHANYTVASASRRFELAKPLRARPTKDDAEPEGYFGDDA